MADISLRDLSPRELQTGLGSILFLQEHQGDTGCIFCGSESLQTYRAKLPGKRIVRYRISCRCGASFQFDCPIDSPINGKLIQQAIDNARI